MSDVAETLIDALAGLGVRTVWGVVGDALNPITDAIRNDERLEWIGVRHEEVGAFAAGAQAQLTGTLGVCMGTVGPGSLHLLNGLYDAKKSHAPVLAICGQVPLAELGSDFFQEVDNDAVFRDVAEYCRTVTSPAQLPGMLKQAVQRALDAPGVSVLTIPGDIAGLDAPDHAPRFARTQVPVTPEKSQLASAAAMIDASAKVTFLVGCGARAAREEVLALADRLSAPMVLTLKAKEGLERDNRFEVGQSGLIGNPAAQQAFESCDLLLMLGTDFPYTDWYPSGKRVIQVDHRPGHIGRRTAVEQAVIGDARLTVAELLSRVAAKRDRDHLDSARSRYDEWRDRQRKLADPNYDARGVIEKVRTAFDNPDERIRPEAVAVAVDRYASERAIFTSDGDRLAITVRVDAWPAAAAGLLQPWLDGQRDAPGARRAGARPVGRGGRVLRRRRLDDADGRPDHRRHLPTAGPARRVQQRPAGNGQARAGAGRAARVRHQAVRRRHRGDRPRRRTERAPR
jgi:pyruvate dehydrogenase (quinone)